MTISVQMQRSAYGAKIEGMVMKTKASLLLMQNKKNTVTLIHKLIMSKFSALTDYTVQSADIGTQNEQFV